MTDLALLVMAAGSGERYGGLKQIEPLGPSGETILDYSIFDALQTGFRKVIFVIRRDIEEVFRAAVGKRIEERLEVHYVFQGEVMPTGSPAVIYRKKPWGTAHAILSAVDVVNEPFGVINADDHYGRESFRVLSDHFRSGSEDAALVGFCLRNTLSDFGPVKRGLCAISHGTLQSVTELAQIEPDGEAVRYVGADGVSRHLTGDEIVSMNMWGFHPAIFPNLHSKWLDFVRDCGQSEIDEFYIPSVITDLIAEGKGSCRVLKTPSSWFGVTYRDDRSVAVDCIRDLILRGFYPERLWS
ncbi:MAG: sugar phosphate nucleotidyltransferase [Streptosporangiaceae bacterium]|jgi:dTDP-glucose pyrophosphorylase